jgi:hypothetical protein
MNLFAFDFSNDYLSGRMLTGRLAHQTQEEVYMKSKFLLLVFLFLLAPFLLSAREGQAAGKTELIGKTSIGWYLASTEDRLINYGPEYYEKNYLIMTFFPAAFTPV